MRRLMFDLFTALPSSTILATIAAALVAGFVRGFTGFGAALIFVPLASAALGPRVAVATLFLIEAIFAVPLTLGAARQAVWRDVLPLAAGATIAAPLGAILLSRLDPITLRWGIAFTVFGFLALIMSGWRYRRSPTLALSVAVGGIAGVFGGAAQMSGPPVVAYWLGGTLPVHTVRANLIAFFAIATVSSGAAYLGNGLLSVETLGLSLAVGPLYALATVAGARVFGVGGHARYRPVAYSVIGLAGILSLPVLDGLIQ